MVQWLSVELIGVQRQENREQGRAVVAAQDAFLFVSTPCFLYDACLWGVILPCLPETTSGLPLTIHDAACSRVSTYTAGVCVFVPDALFRPAPLLHCNNRARSCRGTRPRAGTRIPSWGNNPFLAGTCMWHLPSVSTGVHSPATCF